MRACLMEHPSAVRDEELLGQFGRLSLGRQHAKVRHD